MSCLAWTDTEDERRDLNPTGVFMQFLMSIPEQPEKQAMQAPIAPPPQVTARMVSPLDHEQNREVVTLFRPVERGVLHNATVSTPCSVDKKYRQLI
jgi:hypothetical protein